MDYAYYTLIFAFTPNKICLIRKIKPDWQKGKLNGIGGKVEGNESELLCAQREFKEETGLVVNKERFKRCGSMGGVNWDCEVYGLLLSDSEFNSLKTTTAEELVKLTFEECRTEPNKLSNLTFLIPLVYQQVMYKDQPDRWSIYY